MYFQKSITAMAIGLFALSSCTKEKTDPVIPNEEELITTFTYTLISSDLSDTATFVFKDLDGPGGNAPELTSDTLLANTLYNGSLTLLNEQEVPAEDITEEVEEEGAEHQFFYDTKNTLSINILYADADIDGNPIGLKTTLETMGAENGVLQITLRHMPDKTAPGVADNDITNAGGETDIEVSFDVEIQ